MWRGRGAAYTYYITSMGSSVSLDVRTANVLKHQLSGHYREEVIQF